MTPHWMLAILVAISNPGQMVPPDIDALQALIARHTAAIEASDLGSLDAIYAPDVVVFENGGENRGWPDYRDRHLGPDLKEMKELRYRTTNVIVVPGADLAWATFDYELHAVVNGAAVAVRGKGTMVFKRTPAGWRIAHEHNSSGRRAK